MSWNQRLTPYKEEQAVETTVSTHDELEPETYPLQRGTGCGDDGEQMRRARTRDLHPLKEDRSWRQWSANAMGWNQKLTHYKEGQIMEATVSKYDKQKPETYMLCRGTGCRGDGRQT